MEDGQPVRLLHTSLQLPVELRVGPPDREPAQDFDMAGVTVGQRPSTQWSLRLKAIAAHSPRRLTQRLTERGCAREHRRQWLLKAPDRAKGGNFRTGRFFARSIINNKAATPPTILFYHD